MEEPRERYPLIFQGLNDAQYKAAIANPHEPLQVIAGPGTGKTKVLTSRVAFLLLVKKQPANSIVVTTFTKKAAKEMIDRLALVLEPYNIDLSKLVIGTFHSICVRILRRYFNAAGLDRSFKVGDEKDSNSILQKALGQIDEPVLLQLEALDNTKGANRFLPLKKEKEGPKLKGYDTIKVKRQISRLKSQGWDADDYKKKDPYFNYQLHEIYSQYQKLLKKFNLIDFDDCLLFTYKLLGEGEVDVLPNTTHVLVDEFQDTNYIQLQLTTFLGRCNKHSYKYLDNVTVVGDPDQSIYGFRHAAAQNFENMVHFYSSSKTCSVIPLTHNYRSTSGILSLSEVLMHQQNSPRQPKELQSQILFDAPIEFKEYSSQKREAENVANQIASLVSMPNCVFTYSDVAILIRSAFQARLIEQELLNARIPHKVLQGRAFWELTEIRALIDYLRVVVSDKDFLAIMRTINVPTRGIGLKSIEKLEKEMDLFSGDQIFDLFQDLIQSEKALPKRSLAALASYMEIVESCRAIMKEPIEEREMLCKVFDHIVKTAHLDSLKKSEPEVESCQQNLQELKAQLLNFEPFNQEVDGQDVSSEQSLLESFIDSVDLYEASQERDKGKKDFVSISTIHGSKGLEWPVVFIPGLCDGIFPSIHSLKSKGPPDNPDMYIDEERRCLYVGFTRSKLLLHLSSFKQRSGGPGMFEEMTKSRFLTPFAGKLATKLELYQSQHATLVRNLYRFKDKDMPTSFPFVDSVAQGFQSAALKRAPSELYQPAQKRIFSKPSQTAFFGNLRSIIKEGPAKVPTQVPSMVSTQVPNQVPTQAPSQAPSQAPQYQPTRTKRRLGPGRPKGWKYK